MGLSEDEMDFFKARERICRPVDNYREAPEDNAEIRKRQFIKGYSFNPVIKPKIMEIA